MCAQIRASEKSILFHFEMKEVVFRIQASLLCMIFFFLIDFICNNNFVIITTKEKKIFPAATIKKEMMNKFTGSFYIKTRIKTDLIFVLIS